MKRFALIIVICAVLALQARAVDIGQAQAALFGTEELRQGLEGSASDLMRNYSPSEQADFGFAVSDIFSQTMRQSGGFFRSAAAVLFRILAVVILCRFAGSLGDTRAVFAASVAGTLAITASCAADLHSMIGLGQQTVEDIGSFTTLLLPVLASAAAASGAISGGAAIYGVTALFCDLLIRGCRLLLIPLVYGFLALGVADAATAQSRLGKLRELIGWFIKSILKTILYLFTGFLAATGVISGTADAAALKATKLTISGMVPVVGGIVSDATESLLAGAGVLKSAIGTFGMLGVISIFLLPFLRLGIYYLGFKVTAALCGVLESGQEKLLDTMTAAMGYMLAMTGSCTAMAAIACCCLIKVGAA